MDNEILLATDSEIYKNFQDAAENKRIVFFTGLSGVGKSLYIQQFSKMAEQAGRDIHLLQWDVTREAFQTPEVMHKYPEVDGVTHGMIRKAVGLWTRQAIADWHATYSNEQHILIGELPLIGNRLIEVVQQHNDDVEHLLASNQVQFFLPVPSKKVRNHIIGCRTQSINHPSHERESADAPPSVVNLHWQQIYQMVIDLQLLKNKKNSDMDYDPEIYTAGYMHLLQHRQAMSLPITQVLDIQNSVYELGTITSEIAASIDQVSSIFQHLETHYSLEEVNKMISNWYKI